MRTRFLRQVREFVRPRQCQSASLSKRDEPTRWGRKATTRGAPAPWGELAANHDLTDPPASRSGPAIASDPRARSRAVASRGAVRQHGTRVPGVGSQMCCGCVGHDAGASPDAVVSRYASAIRLAAQPVTTGLQRGHLHRDRRCPGDQVVVVGRLPGIRATWWGAVRPGPRMKRRRVQLAAGPSCTASGWTAGTG
jgi:hypothetical protein